MKLNKIFFGLLGLAAMTMASCSEDDDYKWATVSGPQVYFSDQLPSQYEISPDGNSFNVAISRGDASGSLTVNLTSETAGTMYSIPSSVTFNAGETTANIPVSYDPANIEYGRYDTLTVKIADAAQETSWGIPAYTFTAGVTDWGPWQKWNSAGTATYTYVNFWSGDDPGLPFVYRHNMIRTNLYQFRLSNWGYGVDLVLDYDESTGRVTCATQWTGYDHSSYGYVYCADLAEYCVIRGWDIDPSTDYGTFDQEQGIITIPMAYYVSAGSFGYDPEYIYIDGYVRADYSADLAYAGIFTDVAENVFAVGTLTAGADVATAKALVVSADDDADAVADAIAAGDVEATDVEPGTIYVPIAEDLTGKLQIVAVVVVDGEVKSVASVPFEYYGGAASPWESLGVGIYYDDFIYPMYTQGNPTADPYEVEIQESTETPGLYRMVNPYGEGFVYYPYAESYKPSSIEIHAEDPDGVYIPLQTTGLTLSSGDGEMSMCSYGGYMLTRYDFATLKEYGYFGELKDGVITLPSFEYKNDAGEVQFTYQGLVGFSDGLNYAAYNDAFKLILPEAVSAQARAKARANSKARDFARRLYGKNRFNGVQKDTKMVKKMLMPSDIRVK